LTPIKNDNLVPQLHKTTHVHVDIRKPLHHPHAISPTHTQTHTHTHIHTHTHTHTHTQSEADTDADTHADENTDRDAEAGSRDRIVAH